MYSAYIRPETEVRGSLRLITPEPATAITVVHTIYTIVYGLRFSVQISPGLLSTGTFYFSLRLPRVFGLFLDLVYYCDEGEWRNEYLCPPSANLERFVIPFDLVNTRLTGALQRASRFATVRVCVRKEK